MKAFLTSILFILFANFSYSQLSANKKIIVKDRPFYINTFNNVTYSINVVGKGRKYYRVAKKDTIILDTLTQGILYRELYLSEKDKTLYFIDQDYDKVKIVAYNLEAGTIKPFKELKGEFIAMHNENVLFGERKYIEIENEYNIDNFPYNDPMRTIQKFNILSGKFDVLLTLNYGEDKYLGITEILSFKENIFIEYGILNSDYTSENCQYFKYDVNKGESLLLNPSEHLGKLVSLTNSRVVDDFVITSKFLLDSNLHLLGDVLNKEVEILGFYITDKYSGIYVDSELDKKEGAYKKEKVAIVIKENAIFELLLASIINNKEVESEKLSILNLNELILLKESFWAKHNYKFNDEFLMAYFNLYSFYSYKMDSRKTKVEHKFTPTDKANLRLIEQAIRNKQ